MAPVSPEQQRQMVLKTVTDGLVEFGCERDEISEEASFEDLDLDSLDGVEICQIVEDEYLAELERDDVKDVKTVGGFVDVVLTKLA